MRSLLTLVLVPTAWCICSAGAQLPAVAGDAQAGQMRAVIERAVADVDAYDRFNALKWSADALTQQQRFIESKLQKLREIDLDALSQCDKVDYLLLRNDLRAALAASRLTAERLAQMDAALAFREPIVTMDKARLQMLAIDPRQAADWLAAIPAAVRAAREQVEKHRAAPSDQPAPPDQPAAPGALNRSAALRAARAVDDLARAMERFYEHSDGFDPAFAWWCASPYGEARKALESYARFLREQVAGVSGKPDDPLIGDPIGREALLEELRNECIAHSPEELIALGDAEFAWCEAQMKAAAAEMGLGDDWKLALARVKTDAPSPGGQAAYVREVANEAADFVRRHDLVTVPELAAQTWRIDMLSPHQQRTLPFAVYAGQAIGVAYPTSAMSHEDKLMSMRGNNRHFTRIVVPHELIPGHHLQGYMALRELPYRRRFSTPFYVEGWALYWEMKLWDMGWAKSPENRIGMLFWRMHRCARITVSLKFHLGQMSPQEMIDFLVDRVGHERMGAISEVRRYIGGDYGPLYQAGYMVGGKQVRALWSEAVQSGRMSEKAFNDALLASGPIPIEFIRAELLGITLTKDAEATWKFAGVP